MNKEQILDKLSKLEAELAELKTEVQKSETPEPWRPEERGRFFWVNTVGEVGTASLRVYDASEKMVEVGNCFETPERAAQVAEKFRMLLKLERYHDMFCPDYEPDWKNRDETKFFAIYDSGTKTWDFQGTEDYKDAANVWFDSPETAEKVCELLNEEEHKE